MENKVIRMKKILLLIPLFALLLAVPMACAGSFNMDVSGSGNISFYVFHSDGFGAIKQKYSGSGTVDYQSTYTDGVLTVHNIDADGSGRFGTILKPANTWTASASYSDHDDDDEGTGKGVFRHSWQDTSFTGGGFYRIN